MLLSIEWVAVEFADGGDADDLSVSGGAYLAAGVRGSGPVSFFARANYTSDGSGDVARESGAFFEIGVRITP